MDKYIKQVYKALQCQKLEKQRIINDLKSDIMIALENGETWEAIHSRLGLPEDYAKEFNDNLGVVKKTNKKLFIGIICGIVVGIVCFVGYQYLSSPKSIPIEDSKIFKESELLESSQKVIEIINQKDYQKLEVLYSDIMKKAARGSNISDAMKQLGELGAYDKIKDYQFIEYKDKNGVVAVGDVMALYEKRTVIYRLTFNQDMKLEGIYMR